MDAAFKGPVVGSVLHGTYKISRLIAEGGMGSIYEATHSRLKKKRFAVKILHPRVAEVEELYGRFRREAEIVTGIGHPNIVDVLDFNETEDGLPYMVMEYLDGEDLDARIERLGRLSFDEVLQIASETASALQAVHDRGVVHRDMKPENIFLVSKVPGQVDGPFSVKLLDFGISKIKNSDSIVTKAHTLLGSVHFMSPEQAMGKVAEIDHRSDILALGGICYLMLSGELAYTGETPFAVINALVNEAPRPLGRMVPGLSPAAVQVIERAMAKEREDRFDRVEDFAAELAQALKRRPAAASGRPDGRGRQLAVSPVKALAESGPLEAIRTLENPGSAFRGPGLDLGGLGDLELETTAPGFEPDGDTLQERVQESVQDTQQDTQQDTERDTEQDTEQDPAQDTEPEPEGDATEVDGAHRGLGGFGAPGLDDEEDEVDGDATQVDQMAPVPFDTPAERFAVASRLGPGGVPFETPAAVITDLPLAPEPEDEEAIPLATAPTGAGNPAGARDSVSQPSPAPGAPMTEVSIRWVLYLGLGLLLLVVGVVALVALLGAGGAG